MGVNGFFLDIYAVALCDVKLFLRRVLFMVVST